MKVQERGRGVLNKFPRDHAAREHYRRQRERYTVLCVRCRSKMIRTPSKVEGKHKVSLGKTYYFYRVIKKINFSLAHFESDRFRVICFFSAFLLILPMYVPGFEVFDRVV